MITFSLCMIVKDEEEVIARCLDSIKKVVDEIIIVDTGSTDKTKEIIKNYTDKIYDFKWCDDFSKARNFSFSKATKDYIIWLDADDVILQNDAEKLTNLKNEMNDTIDVVMLKYNLLSNDGSHTLLSFYRERILKRSKNFKWISPIHEVISPSGNVMYKDIAITHKKIKHSDPKRNLRIFNKMIKEGYIFDARQTFYFARELFYDNNLNEAIIKYNNFLKMNDAWSENKISACIDLYSIYNKKNDKEKAINYLFETFKYDAPRSEVCCYIGDYFLQKKLFNISKYWYLQATTLNEDTTNGGFYKSDFKDYIPYINLCICYYNLGDMKNAKKYNDLAGIVKPNDKFFLYNSTLFKV